MRFKEGNVDEVLEIRYNCIQKEENALILSQPA